MAYQIDLSKDAIKDLDKLKKSGVDLKPLSRFFSRIENNPYICSKKKQGVLENIRAIEWGKGYRLLFEIYEKDKTVLITAIDKHDDAYRKAKRRINKQV